MQTKRILRPALLAGFILLLLFLLMQFSSEMSWGPGDFLLAFFFLFGIGLTGEWILGSVHSLAYRLAAGLAAAGAFLLVFVNLAVGVIGSEANAANLLYFAVPVVGVLGAALSRLQPRGMARALLAMAIAHIFATGIGLALWKPSLQSDDAIRSLMLVLGGNALFLALFLASALLFRRDAMRRDYHLHAA